MPRSIAMSIALFAALAVASSDSPAQSPADGREATRIENAHQRHSVEAEVGAALPDVAGKAGIDRFDIDVGRVTESVQADGTVIVHLNGEGMEKMSLVDEAGRPRAVCASLLEAELRRHPMAPTDFRGASVRETTERDQ